MQKPFVSMIRSLMILLYNIRVFGGYNPPLTSVLSMPYHSGYLAAARCGQTDGCQYALLLFLLKFLFVERDNT